MLKLADLHLHGFQKFMYLLFSFKTSFSSRKVILSKAVAGRSQVWNVINRSNLRDDSQKFVDVVNIFTVYTWKKNVKMKQVCLKICSQ